MRRKLGVTGVFLTGGESRRMGRNKALLELDGKKLIERNLEVLSSICGEVLISSREIDPYAGYGYKVIPDIIRGKGPLGGLYSVLQQAGYKQLFLAACDMPFLNEKAIAYFYSETGDYDAVVPYASGKLHPLHAFYHQRILPLVEKNMQEDKLRLTELLSACRTKYVNCSEELKSKADMEFIERSLWNANTPEEWEKARKNNF